MFTSFHGGLAPAEVGPHLRLNYQDQPLNEWLRIAMKPITDSDGCPNVFSVVCTGEGSWLDEGLARPDDEWDPGSAFVFRLRK